MDNNFTLKEYGLFIKHNRKTIIIVTILTMAIILGGFLFSRLTSSEGTSPSTKGTTQVMVDEEVMQSLLDENFDELTPEQQNQLLQYLDSESFSFRVLIEDEEGRPYNYFKVLKEILTTSELTEAIEMEVGSEFKPDSKRGVILEFNPETYIMTVKVGVGDAQLNEDITQVYYNLLQSEDFDFNQNKTIHFIDEEPMMTTDEEQEIDPEEVMNQAPSSNVGTLIVLGFISVLAGLLLGVLVSFIMNFFNKQITYLYDYKIDGNGKVYKFFGQNNDESIVYTIENPKSANKMIISETVLERENISSLKNNMTTTIHFTHDLAKTPDINENTELIILTKINSTSKKWYQEQLRKAIILDLPVKVIQI